MRRGLPFVIGSLVVYLVVVACAESVVTRALSDAGEAVVAMLDAGAVADGPAEQGDSGGVSGSPEPASPVPAAMAQPSAPAVVDADCECGESACYAEASFPGRSVTELAGVFALTAVDESSPPGYSHIMTRALVLREGGVAMMCGTAVSHPDTVRFVLP